MLTLKATSSGMIAALIALTASACQSVDRDRYYGGRDEQKNGAEDAAAEEGENSLIKNSSKQESFLTFQGLDASRPAHPVAGKPMTAQVSLAVSGQLGEEEGTIWQALAASFASSSAKTTSNDAGSLYLSDAGVVSLVDSSDKVITLGRLGEVGLDNPIMLDPGVKPMLMVEGNPFDVAVDDKQASGMSIEFAVP